MNTRDFGKAFESKVKECFQKSFPQGYILRLADQQSQYLGASSNPADFIAYNHPHLFLLEAKSVQTASFPFSNLRQYDKLLAAAYKPGIVSGVVMWFTNKDLIWFVPIVTIKKLKDNNIKSINPDKLNREKYYIVPVPSVKLRTFMNSDYSVLMDVLPDEEIYSQC